MLDGLDEVPQTQREKVSKWANWQMQAYPTPFILTSRPHGYECSEIYNNIQSASGRSLFPKYQFFSCDRHF